MLYIPQATEMSEGLNSALLIALQALLLLPGNQGQAGSSQTGTAADSLGAHMLLLAVVVRLHRAL